MIKYFLIKFILIFMILLLVIIMVGPFVWMVSTSFKKSSDVFTEAPNLLPISKNTGKLYFTVENFKIALKYGEISKAFINSILVATSATILNLLINSLAAFGFARLNFPGKNIIFRILLSTMMIPFYATLIPMLYITKLLGMYNSLAGLVIPMCASVFNVFLMKQFFQTIPQEMEDAACIDGCSRFGVYWRIILPLSKPVLTVVGITTFIWHWNSYTWPLVLINDPKHYTLPLQLALLVSGSGSRYNYMMAAATMAVVPILIVFIVFQRYLIQGIVLSGLKG